MPNVALALHLLSELYNPESFWAPYLSALPGSYDTVMYFTADDLKELRGSPVFGKHIRKFIVAILHVPIIASEDSLRMCRNIARQYSYFYSLLQVNRAEVYHL